MKRILIIEDDADIAAIERDYLALGGFDVTLCGNGTDGLALALGGGFDLVILDLMLPGTDGFTVCRELRERSDVPVIMVTARHEDADMIRGFGFGADDYVEKPFSPSVLVARVKAHLARCERLRPEPEKPAARITYGDMTLDTETRRLFIDGREVPLKNKEYELLCFLMRHPDRVFGREDLYEHIWGLESMGDNITVAVHINRLREKIEKDPQAPRHLRTVWGAGYRFCP
mgnify:CR=1 FL=1